MKSLELWEICAWDGGSRQTPTGQFFTNKAAAEEYMKVNKHDYINHKVLLLVDDMEDLKNAAHAEMRKRALAKLSPEDKMILNLKD